MQAHGPNSIPEDTAGPSHSRLPLGGSHNASGSGISSDEPQGYDDGSRLQTDADAWNTRNILSLDGGGVRGLWTLHVLERLMVDIGELEMEEDVRSRPGHPQQQRHSHSFSPQPYPKHVCHERIEERVLTDRDPDFEKLSAAHRYLPCHYFDLIGGTSTGALIAIMLGRLRMSVRDCIAEYETLAGKIFGKPRCFIALNFGIGKRTKYKSKRALKVFRDVVERRGEEGCNQDSQFMSTAGLCQTMVLTLRTKERTVRVPHLIRSYTYVPRQESRRIINSGPPANIPIPIAAQAATAAPEYFDPVIYQEQIFEDGGLGNTSNPTHECVKDIEEVGGRGSIGVVVSIGTAKARSIDNNGFRARVQNLIGHVASPEIVHNNMRQRARDFEYVRLNPQLDQHLLSIELDEWLPRRQKGGTNIGQVTMEKILSTFRSWYSDGSNAHRIRECARTLVARRRARIADRARWEHYAENATFRCMHMACTHKSYNRDEMERHVRKHKDRLDVDFQKTAWEYKQAAAH